jgi:heptosyltransferase-1
MRSAPNSNVTDLNDARILIIRLGAIGDVVHTLPSLAALRRRYPRAYLAWAVERGGATEVLRGSPFLDELIVLDMRAWRRGMLDSEMRTAMAEARRKLSKFDLAIDFQGLLKSAFLPRLAGINRRIGFDFGALREPAAGLLLTERVQVDDTIHIIEKNLELVRHLGCRSDDPYGFPIVVDPADEEFAQRLTEQVSQPFALLNPGGGWATKLWQPEKFGHLADRLRQKYGFHSFITYGPGEEKLAEAAAQGSRFRAAHQIASSLKEFFALAQRAELFVGGDTGPMHLAAAAGTPVVALFGPSSARRNGPFDPNDIIVERDDLECRVDCYRRKCDHCSCLNLDLEAVWAGVERRLISKNTDDG